MHQQYEVATGEPPPPHKQLSIISVNYSKIAAAAAAAHGPTPSL